MAILRGTYTTGKSFYQHIGSTTHTIGWSLTIEAPPTSH